MTTANPLVAQRQDSTQWYHGLGLVESVNDTAQGIESGSWVDTSLGVLGAGLDTLGLVLDPVGSVVSWGIAWLMEHLEPLSEALDALAGDPDQIAANAQTWKNVAGAVTAAAQELQDAIARDIAQWSGPAAEAYRANAGAQLEALAAISRASGAIGTGVEIAGTIVGVVREIVRDLIAECISTLAVRLPMWLAEVGLTLGIGTPWVAGQVAALVAKWVNRISGFLEALIKSFRKLAPLLSKLDEIIAALKKGLRGIGGGNAPHARGPDGLPGGYTGARYVDEVDPRDAAIYDLIRGSADDTAQIADNTGIPRNILDQIKDHLFFREHDLPLGPNQTGRANFSPDPDIADLWPKAQAGTLSPEEAARFRRLMAHEYVESSLMNNGGLPYRSSHPDAWDPDLGNYPTPEHHGAHDLAPLTDPNRDPFAHWERVLGRDHPGVSDIAPDLSNLDGIIEQILGGGR